MSLTAIANDYYRTEQRLNPIISDDLSLLVHFLKTKILKGELNQYARDGKRSHTFWSIPFDDYNFKLYSDVAKTYDKFDGTSVKVETIDGILYVRLVW